MKRPDVSIAAIALASWFAVPAHAQPSSDPSPPAEATPAEESADEAPRPMPMREAIERITSAYTSAPVSEDVEITLATPDGVSRRDVFIAIDAQPSGIRAMFLELGPLRVFAQARAEGVRLLIDRPRNHRQYADIQLAAPISPNALARHLPPIPLPQIAIAAGLWSSDPSPDAPGGPDAILTFANVHWLGAALDPVGPWITLVGRCGDEPGAPAASVRADAITGRLLAASIEWPDRASALDLRVRAIEIPDAPLAWRIAPDGRQPVPTAADLIVSTEPRREGSPMPELPLMTSQGGEWSWRSLLDAPADETLATGRVGVLILARDAVLRERPEPVDALLRASRQASIDEGVAVSPSIAICGVVDLSAWTPERVREIAAAWEARASVIYAIGAGSSIDAFAPGADVVALVVGPAGEILGVIEPSGPGAGNRGDAPSQEELAGLFRAAYEPVRRLVRIHNDMQQDASNENAPDAGGAQEPG